MPSFHISSSGKLVKCKNDPCKLHAGTDFRAKDLKEAQKLAENAMNNSNPESLNKVENSNIQDYNNAIKNMNYEEFSECLANAIKNNNKQDYCGFIKAAGIEPEYRQTSHGHEVIDYVNVGHKGRFVGFEVSSQRATLTALAKNLNMSDDVVKNAPEWKNHDKIIEKFKTLSHDEQQSVMLDTLWDIKAGA